MSAAPHEFQRFLRRAHRRNIAWRLLERTGLGILGGSVAALPLLAIVIWRGGDAFSFAMVSMGVGALAGLLWGFLRRPSPLATALEADRQLGWADLLSSAAMVRSQTPQDPYAAAVLWAADTRCRGTSPSALVLHRLGARAWGGIGLASALVLVLGLFPAFATSSQAGNRDRDGSRPIALFEPAEPSTTHVSQPLVRRTAREQDPDDPNASKMGESERESKDRSDRTSQTAPHRSEDHPNQSTNSDGHGTGASESSTDQSNGLSPPTPSNGGRSDPNAAHANGGVGQSTRGTGDGTASGASAGQSASPARVTPPWRSSGWADDSRRAIDAVESGAVPDSYRDVIRAYFDRP